MSDPSYGGQGPGAGGQGEAPRGKGGVVTAIVIGSLALIAAVVAIVLVLTRSGDGDADASPTPTPSDSATPSATPTETAPSPTPEETAAPEGGTGTQDDPFLLGQEFLYEASVVGWPTDTTWNVVIEGVEEVPPLTAEGPCYVVYGTMTPLTLPGDVATGEDQPSTGLWMDDFSVANFADEGQCDVAGYTDGRYWSAVGWDFGEPVDLPSGDGPFPFWEAYWIADSAGGGVQWVTVGYDGVNEDVAYYVSGTESLE